MKTKGPLTKNMLIVADTVVDPLIPLLECSNESPTIRVETAPYSQVYQVLMNSNHEIWRRNPDYLLLWTIPILSLPSFKKIFHFDPYKLEEIWSEVDRYAELIVQISKKVELVLQTSFTLPSYLRWIQTLTWKHNEGVANILARANLRLSECFANCPNIVFLDTNYWQNALLGRSHDFRLYSLGKIFFSRDLFEIAASEIKAVIRGILGLGKKVIVCDLDNTLWGGVAVDDGMESIKLGGLDATGECFFEFQRALLSLKNRGILLTICSKNDEAFALSVIEKHPEMLLRKEDFVSWRINWREKAENLISLSEELRLGLDSFVFLDDSPQERDQVRRILPEVFAPDMPSSPTEYVPFIHSLNCFETSHLSAEDFGRTSMYQAERSRKNLIEIIADVEAWLSSLKIIIKAAPLKKDTLPRATQLLNKTNQFNLSVRRLEEQALWEWAGDESNSFYVFHVSDKFGDLGLVGLASFTKSSPKQGRLVDFVMSCRAMGKRVEEAILSFVVSKVRDAGIESLAAPSTPTDRNGPVREFFKHYHADNSSEIVDQTKVLFPAAIQLIEEK